MSQPSLVRKLAASLRPDARRVLIRPFWPAQEPRLHHPADVPRALKIMTRIAALTETEAERQWQWIREDFDSRHLEVERYFLRRFDEVAPWLPTDAVLTETRRLLIGSYFTHEYSLEAAALFNPSVVVCPDQSGLPDGALRFILSLRAVGEGHISSISFRCGTLTSDFEVDFGEPARWVVEAHRVVDESFRASWFHGKCKELGVDCDFLDRVFASLPEFFNEGQLHAAVTAACGRTPDSSCLAAGERLLLLAKSNFSVAFSPQQRFSERIIFPVSPSETNGIEDARFVRFIDDDGAVRYYATYTAYDGRVILPQLLETEDFLHFRLMHAQRAGGAEQRHGPLPAQDRRPLRDAVAGRTTRTSS